MLCIPAAGLRGETRLQTFSLLHSLVCLRQAFVAFLALCRSVATRRPAGSRQGRTSGSYPRATTNQSPLPQWSPYLQAFAWRCLPSCLAWDLLFATLAMPWAARIFETNPGAPTLGRMRPLPAVKTSSARILMPYSSELRILLCPISDDLGASGSVCGEASHVGAMDVAGNGMQATSHSDRIRTRGGRVGDSGGAGRGASHAFGGISTPRSTRSKRPRTPKTRG